MREQRGGDRRTATGKAREMPEVEVNETAKVKLTEQQPEEIKPQEETKRSAEMSEMPKIEAEMVSEESNRKTQDEERKDPEILEGGIRAAVKPELSEQQPEELQPQESLKRLTMELEITCESELMTETSRDTEKNKPRAEEMISLVEAKVVEKDETQVYETPAASRLAEVQDRAVENEITERGRGTRSMMLSRLSGAAEEMSASFQMELPKTLIDEGRGAAGVEEAAEEMFRRDTASEMMQKLRKTGDQTMEKETPEKEQPAELLSPEKCVDSRKAENGKWNVLRFDLESGGEEQGAKNNKKERKWGKENKNEEAKVAGNTVQMELAVVAEESSSRAVAKAELKEKPEN